MRLDDLLSLLLDRDWSRPAGPRSPGSRQCDDEVAVVVVAVVVVGVNAQRAVLVIC